MRGGVLGLVMAVVLSIVVTNSAYAELSPAFKLGFKALADQLPDVVGQPLENEHFNLANGNSEQRTSNGLMVWRKADNWTAFTDGSRTWINGPNGIETRLNYERFDWEKDPPATATAIPSPRVPTPPPATRTPIPAAAAAPTPTRVPSPTTDWHEGPGAIRTAPIVGTLDGIENSWQGTPYSAIVGWAVDYPPQPHDWYRGADFKVYADGMEGSGGRRIDFPGVWELVERPDVVSALKNDRDLYAGFRIPIDTSGMAAGVHILYVYVYGIESGWWVKPMSVTLTQPASDQASPSQPSPTPVPYSPPAARTSTPTPRPVPAAPAPVYFTADPVGPVKVEAGSRVTVGPIPMKQTMIMWVRVYISFNAAIPTLAGDDPTIDVNVSKGGAVLASAPNATNGYVFQYQAPSEGDYMIILDNSRSWINAKQVSLEFLSP